VKQPKRGKRVPTFSKKTQEYIRNPKNVGEIANASSVGEAGDPHTSNYLKMWIRVTAGSSSSGVSSSSGDLINEKTGVKADNRIIEEIGFKAFGCVPAIASGSALTEMVKGKTVSYALSITPSQIEKELGGLPAERRFCCKLAIDTLKNAIAKTR